MGTFRFRSKFRRALPFALVRDCLPVRVVVVTITGLTLRITGTRCTVRNESKTNFPQAHGTVFTLAVIVQSTFCAVGGFAHTNISLYLGTITAGTQLV